MCVYVTINLTKATFHAHTNWCCLVAWFDRALPLPPPTLRHYITKMLAILDMSNEKLSRMAGNSATYLSILQLTHRWTLNDYRIVPNSSYICKHLFFLSKMELCFKWLKLTSYIYIASPWFVSILSTIALWTD